MGECWCSVRQGAMDVKLPGGQTDECALYAVDWDNWGGGRSERVDMIDDNTGTVLNSQTLSGFQNGVYLVWNLTSSVTVRVTNLNPSSNAVVSGLFFAVGTPPPPPPPPPPTGTNSAASVKPDPTTHGNCKAASCPPASTTLSYPF